MNALSQARGESGLTESNRRFYDGLWADARLVEPQRFNTWPLISELCEHAERRLEIAPGLHALRERNAKAAQGLIGTLPFQSHSFDVVCAFDIVEHVADDDAAFAELSRVAVSGATLLLSVPLHPQAWTAFDDFVGHCRRYAPDALAAK